MLAFFVHDVSMATTNDASKEVQGRARGGLARAQALSPEERQKIAKDAAKARWSNPSALVRATHEGKLQIGNAVIACAVLEDGRRLLTQSTFMRALGRARQAKGRQYYDGDVNLPAFLTAKNLKPFIPNELYVTSSQIEFRLTKGRRAYGYSADLLPMVCGVFVDAFKAGVLKDNQEHIADQAYLLMRSLAHTGIIALVDEATGYQKVRDREALQKILDRYIAKELAKWAKRFPDEFYVQMFRLKGWKHNPASSKRPMQMARVTLDLVYDRLGPGLSKELKARRNEIFETTGKRGKLQQVLTREVGHPALQDHLSGLMFIGKGFADGEWEPFHRFVDRAMPPFNRTLPLPFPENSDGDDRKVEP